MDRFAAYGCVLLVAALLQACSLNPFGGSKPKPSAAPEAGAEAASGDPPKPRRQSEAMALKRFDADSDGALTRPELEQTLVADFKKEDANHDEVLDPAEARALNERLRQEKNLSPVFDWNADGRLVYAEFATQWRTLFDRADRDRDGIVTEDEFQGPGRARIPPPMPKPELSRVDPTRR
jgi:Ca2+-binding EF-hand superfamily protein